MTTNSCWMVRYATPPLETAEERKKRLGRKRQVAYYLRRKTAAETLRVKTENVSNLPALSADEDAFTSDRRARHAKPPRETAEERKKGLSVKRPAAYRLRRFVAIDPLKVEVAEISDLSSQSLDKNSFTVNRRARHAKPPQETAEERKKGLSRKRQATYYYHRKATADHLKGILNLPSISPDEGAFTADRLARYTTPPRESAKERKKRLNRKRQAAYRHRRTASADPLKVEVVEISELSADKSSFTVDRRARHATPPRESAKERKKRLDRKRHAAYYLRRKTAAKTLKVKTENISNLPALSADEDAFTSDRLVRYATPPRETPEERKKRLNRKRQAAYRHRRTASADPLKVEVAEISDLSSTNPDMFVGDCMVRFEILPEEIRH